MLPSFGSNTPRWVAWRLAAIFFLLVMVLALPWLVVPYGGTRVGTGAMSNSTSNAYPAPGAVSQLRVATYNIHWGLGADGVRDLDRTAAVLRAIDADIVLLNEVDVNWRRSRNVDQPAYLAQAAGYPYMYFGPALHTWSSGGLRSSLYGNLLLSRYPLRNARTIPLPTGPWRGEPRAAVMAQVLIGHDVVTVLGTHLGLSQAERIAQTARLQELASSQPGPVMLMGDFNAHPGTPEIHQLLHGPSGLVDTHLVAGRGPGLTFPTGQPAARIDYVFVSPELVDRVLRAGPWSADASDHLPVVVELAWPP